ncbi:MAG: S9 family peptidase [Bacteroidetes bacterium]|nr:S9 family peptidase [Bacteroidota bacterium]
MRKLLSACAIILSLTVAAQKTITVEDIWTNYVFYPSAAGGFNAMKDGLHYTDIEDDTTTKVRSLVKYELKTGKKIATLVKDSQVKVNGKMISLDAYSFSPDESKLLLTTESEHIYRRSAKTRNYVYDFKTEKTVELSANGKQMFPTFSPVGNKVAFVRDNNLFIKNLDTDQETQVTRDGADNKIKNGWADWVYEEEFSKADMFCWNADGSKLAFVRFDESRVREYSFDTYNNHLYPDKVTFKYPKAGEDNSIVSVHVFDLASGNTTTCDIGKETDIYIPRIQWTTDKNTLSIQRMNRLQNKLELLFANVTDGSTKAVLTEDAQTYIDITDDLTFLPGNKGFIWSSEKDNYNHLYHYDINGKLVKQITSGKWDIIEFKGFDDKTNTLYYVSTEQGPINRDVYSIKLDGSAKKRLSPVDGTSDAEFSTGYKYYVSTYSNANTPPVYELHSADGKLIKVLEDNAGLKSTMKEYKLSTKEFFKFKTSEGIELNGWMMKPANFDQSKKYPVYMFAYNGPGSNECNNAWETFDYWWHQLLCQEGYIVVCVDGRGTLGRGREFKHSTYLQLGKLETIDQIEVAKYLGTLSYVDKARIGFQGWSFGGYMASLLISKGADQFKMAIAVAPVTNWKFYDNIYTERFLRKPQDNKSGYEDNSPVNFTDKIKGKFLLVHGSGDDNVHYQNSMELAAALVKNNIPFEFMTYPNKNHGIYGGYTRTHLYNKMLEFVKKNL